jgi:hypothetical protein
MIRTNRVPRTSRDTKLEHILSKFPEALKSTPRTDVKLIQTIKRSMIDSGLYANGYDSANAALDSTIIKMIEQLQVKSRDAKKSELTKIK